MGLNYSMSTTDSSTLKGIIGETIALHYLYRNKYEILQKNFNCRYGEVDIIAIRGSTIHFVEVKAWSAFGYENVAYAVNERRKRRMIQTAIFFLQQFPKFAGHALMFSLLFIDMSSLTCRYIEAAFEEEEW